MGGPEAIVCCSVVCPGGATEDPAVTASASITNAHTLLTLPTTVRIFLLTSAAVGR